MIETFDIDGAASFLKMHPDTLQRQAASGKIPAAKVAGKWVFLNIHLAEWLQSQYSNKRQTQKECRKKRRVKNGTQTKTKRHLVH